MQKFVITIDGELRFGDVQLHKDLLPPFDTTCYGGGFWKLNAGGMAIDLYGRSFDFGAPDLNMIHKIDWSGIGGNPLPLHYYPNYPDLDHAKLVMEMPF